MALLTATTLAVPGFGYAQYTYVPSNNQSGNWNVANRWTGGPAGTFPNAVDATATFNLPNSTAPSGNYNVQLSNTAGQSITVGAITVNNSDTNPAGTTTRFGANGNGTLTFQSSSGPATYTENAAANGATTFFAPVTFASDTVITQNQAPGNNNGTSFNSSNNSPGGITAAPGITLTKEGPGNVSFSVAPTAPASGFQGSVVVNQGAVRDEANVFQNAQAVTVNNGGQYQLGSSSITNFSLAAGAKLTLNGPGKATGASPEGAFRFQNPAASASFDSPVVLASDSSVYVNANTAPTPPNPVTYATFTLTNEVSGEGGLIKEGAGNLVLTSANTYANGTTVKAGKLVANNTTGSATGTGAVTVEAGATLAGSGLISGDVNFVGGTLGPGTSPGTLTLGNTSLDSTSLLAYELAAPGIVGSGINDLTVVNGNLTLDGILNITDLGGFGIGTYRLFEYTGLLADNGLDIGTAPAGFSFAIDTSIANQVSLNVTAVPEPSTIALVALGGVILGTARTVRRRKVASAV